MLNCDTITWVSSLKPWRALLAKRGLKIRGDRPAKLRRLEGALDRSLGAVCCDADSEVVKNDDGYAADYEDHQPDDQLDSLATQPFEGGSNEEDSEAGKCEGANDEDSEEEHLLERLMGKEQAMAEESSSSDEDDEDINLDPQYK